VADGFQDASDGITIWTEDDLKRNKKKLRNCRRSVQRAKNDLARSEKKLPPEVLKEAEKADAVIVERARRRTSN